MIAGSTHIGTNALKKARLASAVNLTNNSPVISSKNLSIWLEPTLPQSNLDNEAGQNISNWKSYNPQSSGQIATIQDDENYMPQYVENGINHLPSVQFDGEDDYLYISDNQAISPTNEFTIFIVFEAQEKDVNGGFSGILSKDRGDGSAQSPYEINLNNGSNKIKLSVNKATNGQSVGNSSSSIEFDKPYVLSATHRPGTDNFKLYINGQLEHQGNGVDQIYDNSSNLNIGQEQERNSNFFKGLISEVIILDKYLNNTKRQEIEEYLLSKYQPSPL